MRPAGSWAACLLIGALVARSGSADAQEEQLAQGQFATLGAGAVSCATAEQSQYRFDRDGWVMGYFTAANVFSSTNRAVGTGTDDAGIWAEVDLECSANPSESFEVATRTVYFKLRQEGR